MKNFPKQSKTERQFNHFYFGNYGEIPLGISSVTINEDEFVDDKLHYHKKGIEFYLTTKGEGVIEIEGKEFLMNGENLIMVEAGEKHRIKKVTSNPFSFIVIYSK